MHMSQIVTSPKAMDTAYGPEPVYELARQKNTDAAVYNADSWTMTALAIFAQMEFNLSSPPIPLKYHPGSNSSLLPPKHLMYVDAGGVTPCGVPAGKRPYLVNNTLWEVYTPSSNPDAAYQHHDEL